MYDGELKIIEGGDNLFLTDYQRDLNEELGIGIMLPSVSCFIPDPGNEHQLYFFNSPIKEWFALKFKSYFSLIERDSMGEYRVREVEHPFYTRNEEHFVPIFIRHGNGRDWWIIVIAIYGEETEIEYYLLNTEGISFSHSQKTDLSLKIGNFGFGDSHGFSLDQEILTFTYVSPEDEEFPGAIYLKKLWEHTREICSDRYARYCGDEWYSYRKCRTGAQHSSIARGLCSGNRGERWHVFTEDCGGGIDVSFSEIGLTVFQTLLYGMKRSAFILCVNPWGSHRQSARTIFTYLPVNCFSRKLADILDAHLHDLSLAYFKSRN